MKPLISVSEHVSERLDLLLKRLTIKNDEVADGHDVAIDEEHIFHGRRRCAPYKLPFLLESECMIIDQKGECNDWQTYQCIVTWKRACIILPVM
jgi:hypothetical protein